jgi:hypothetical protein
MISVDRTFAMDRLVVHMIGYVMDVLGAMQLQQSRGTG